MSLPLQYLSLCGYKSSNVPEKKKKVGIYLPYALADALDALVKAKVNGKQKWVVASAAVLSLLEMTSDEQNEYIRRLNNADSPGQSFAALLEESESKRKGKSGVPTVNGGNARIASSLRPRQKAAGRSPSPAKPS